MTTGQLASQAPMVEPQVQNRAQSALAASPIYELRELRVHQREEILVIEGCVSSFYHKQLAQEIVLSVCKGVRLTNLIEVQESDDVSVSWIR